MLTIPDSGALDFLAVGALVHRLDPGVVPFPHASELAIHVSGGEYNCAANLASCFGMRTGVAAAMVSYPIGDLIDRSVRAMGVRPFYKRFAHDGKCAAPNMATVYSDRGAGVRAPEVFYNRANEAAARLRPGDFDWSAIMRDGVRWLHSGGIFAALSEDDPAGDRGGHAGCESGRRGGLLRPELPRQAVADSRRRGHRPRHVARHRQQRRRAGRQRGRPAGGPRHRRAGGGRGVQARPARLSCR